MLQKKHPIATMTQLRSLELLIAKTPLLHMLYYMNWLTYEFWTRTGGWEFDRSHGASTSSPSHSHDNRSRNRRRNLWVGWRVSSWWPLFPSRSSVLIYVCILYMSFVIGHIYTNSRSVIQYWWSCTPSHSTGLYFWGVSGSWVECHFLLSLVYQLCLALW